ncbi:hypothetical protein FD754_018060 [Muntiacus muntjak]|uniref:Uncharacterized protein n=1 Tax=Muntiacus muntjak TaxID=9888 RepID=A0A5N3UWE4_MUNMU|nr:hypothetical protein FD754_018060 [Muntiacus muntjak]
MKEVLTKHKSRTQLKGQEFTDALLIIPKFLFIKIQAEHSESGLLVNVDLNTDEPLVAEEIQLLHFCTVIATNILLINEIMRGETNSLKH